MCDQCHPYPPPQVVRTTVSIPAGSFTFWPSACRADCRCPACRPDIHVTGALPSPVAGWLLNTAGANG